MPLHDSDFKPLAGQYATEADIQLAKGKRAAMFGRADNFNPLSGTVTLWAAVG
jgi:hypothetical protein